MKQGKKDPNDLYWLTQGEGRGKRFLMERTALLGSKQEGCAKALFTCIGRLVEL